MYKPDTRRPGSNHRNLTLTLTRMYPAVARRQIVSRLRSGAAVAAAAAETEVSQTNLFR